MSKARGRVLGILKWVFAAAVLTLLIRSGKLSVKDVQTFLRDPMAGGTSLVLILGVFACAFLRWKVLLESQGISLGYWKVFQLGMLGQFFTTVIPGTVGGDLIKAVFIARRFPEHKVRTISTILMDRIMGLSSMITLAAVAFLVGHSKLATLTGPSVHLIELMGWAIVAVAASILIGLLALPAVGRRLPDEMPKSWVEKLPVPHVFGSLYISAKAYYTKTSSLWLAMCISFVMHSMNMTVLYLVAKAVFGPAPWGNIDAPLFVMGSMLGMAAMALPIAPMGLGVGQVAFAGIFYALGAPNETFGASMVTGMQVVSLCMNLSGALFFATYRHEVQAGAELSA